MRACVFPGQGAQKKGMGADLFPKYPEYVALADELLGFSVEEFCAKGEGKWFFRTKFIQPIMYIVCALSYLDWLQTEGPPDFLAGHSVGELSALFASGAFDFETGLRIVKSRGELMDGVRGGGMAAVIGANEDTIREILQEKGLNTIDIANYNTPTQYVISGPIDDIYTAEDVFDSDPRIGSIVVLRVSGAFHSRYMEPVSREFYEILDQFSFSPLKIPVIANRTARPYIDSDIKRMLAEQLCNPVLWTESVKYMLNVGVKDFFQCGPGHATIGLVNKIIDSL